MAASTCQADRYWTNVNDVTATANQLVPYSATHALDLLLALNIAVKL